MLLTISEIANFFKCSEGTARICIDRFSLPHERKGKLAYWEVDTDKLEEIKAFYIIKKQKNTRIKKTQMNLRLTDRESEVMELLCAGYSSSGIADKLGLKRCSISSHFRRIYKKYGLKQNEQWNIKMLAVRKYLENKRKHYEQMQIR